ncbi:MAG: hypothetical protein FD175_1193 [Beijerinckiaceae bacterium]|nr:MAG: hypothetical protein FD175_1193 [Beijerinckiaceae bacterium]
MIGTRQSGHRRLLPHAIAGGLLIALTGTILPTTLLAAEIIGLAESVTNRVTGDISGIRRELAPDADVHRNEIIRTEAQSATRLRFADRSDLRLGPQAQIRLDAFVFSGNAGSAMNLSRGALRFVSGNGPTGSYQIKTPVATIGLRGTGVDVVLRSGRVFVTLLEGAARVCVGGGQCTDLVNRCDYVEAGGGRAQPARPLNSTVPTFNSACSGTGCGQVVCASSAAAPSPSPSRAGTPAAPGYDPTGGSAKGGDGSSSGGGGKGR